MERGDKKGLESKMDQYITMKKGFDDEGMKWV
jgi:hypothetical protein